MEEKAESFPYVFPLPAFLLPSCSPELTGADVPLSFQRMPVHSGQLLLVALDQDVGFVLGPTIAECEYRAVCISLLLSPSWITINGKGSLGAEQIALPFLLVGLPMILWHLVLSYNSL